MTTQINQNNIQPATLAALDSSPTVTNVQITDSSYVVIDDTAVLTTGGYIKITGSNLVTGCQVILGSANATSVTFVNSTTLNVQVPAQAAGTYVVYVVNPDGGVAIRVNGLTYSGNPTWVTGSTLPEQPANTAISIQLVATGDAPLTYAVQAGSSLPSGVALSSGGLITGSVAVGVQTLYNFTIEAIDAESQESPRAFTVTITVGDTYWDYVTTLISANSPTTSVFVDDASTNNFPVSIFGDTKPNNFSPYTPGYYSNLFDGTGDYLSVPSNSALAFPGDFTMEAWVYFTTSGVACGFVSTYQPNTTYGTVLGMNSSNVLVFRLGVDAGGFQAVDSVAIVPGVWYHVAGVRSGNTMTLYKNGVSVGSVGSVNITSDTTTAVLGRYYTNFDNFYLTGYISNARIVKGTAVYTANFTPPTVPLTAITNTSLLTCQSNRFIDNSTNNLTLTANGNTSINGFDPFLPNISYSAYGSTYFDGTGDYLDIPSNAAFAFGTGNFTIECWMFNTDAGTTKRTAFKFSNPLMALTTNNSIASGIGFWDGSAVRQIVFTPNVWQHIAIVRISGTLTIYLNGVNQNSAALATSIAASNISIGAENTQFPFLGYISDFRVTNTGVYTSNFTPPTAPVTAITGTQLLTCQTNQPVNNNVFIDNSTNNLFITRNGNATQGTFSPYGENWSNYFDGTGDYLLSPSNAAFAFGTGDFTVEGWFYNTTGTNNGIFQISSPAGGFGGVAGLALGVQSNKYSFYYNNGSSAVSTGLTINSNAWNHFAVVKSSNVTKVYLNGVLDTGLGTSGSITDTTNYTGTYVTIGGFYSNAYLWLGYLSNLRIVKGNAAYTTNFTPSTTPLLPIAGTVLLTCKDPNIVDDSANRFTITRTGDVSVQKFGPFASTTLPTPYYSGYFDGSGDYVTTVDNSSFIFGTGDFTIECWINTSSTTQQFGKRIVSHYTFISNTDYGWQLEVLRTSSTTIKFFGATTGVTGINLTTNNTVTPSVWHHIAVVRSGSVASLYLDGTRVATQTGVTWNDTNTVTNGIELGSQANTAGTRYDGYISNVRVVKGSAVYDPTLTTLTVPTSPLTAISGTSLLTCQSNRFIDNSTNNFTLTVFGNTTPSTFAPFSVSYSTNQGYTPAVFGGSVYFDGSGDYLSTGFLPALANTWLNNVTVECWVYFNSVASSPHLWSIGESGSIRVTLYVSSAALRLYIVVNSGGDIITSPTTLTPRQWYHVAITRSGTTWTMWLNGISQGTSTSTTRPFGPNEMLALGWQNFAGAAGDYLNGYVSDFRIVVGTALYTSSFVPQNMPLTPVQNTVLLVNGTSAGVYDSSMMNDYETVGDAKIDTTVVKFTGTESVKFDGTTDYVVVPTNLNYGYGTGDFTIEFWVYFNTVSSDQTILSNLTSGSSINPHIYLGQTGSTIRYFTNSADRIVGSALSINTWYHIAISRSSGSTRMFINGTQSGSTYTDSNNYGTSAPLGIGTYYSAGSPVTTQTLNGYVSDVRITKGIARYTTTFTPPTSPFQTT